MNTMLEELATNSVNQRRTAETAYPAKYLNEAYQAMSRSQAMIEFDLDGVVIHANENFLSLFGYSLDQVVGQHHRMFCTAEQVVKPEYRIFWNDLKSGQFKKGEFHRIAADGSDLHIQASYNPIFGEDGKTSTILKFASDITATKIQDY